MTEAFYVRDGDDRYLSTEWTRGPWGPDSQHAGPPSALLGQAVEQAGREDLQVARITFEILKPIPVAPLTLSTEVRKGGRRVELVDAALSADGEVVMTATAVRMRTADIDLPAFVDPPPPHDIPESSASTDLFPATWHPNYLEAMEWRFATGMFTEPGPAAAWVRMRHPLVAGEPVSPLTRVLSAVDSASGISAMLEWTQWVFINPDLSVHLHRMPARQWILIDASTTPASTGVGTASASIYDERGRIGFSLQSLLISPRG